MPNGGLQSSMNSSPSFTPPLSGNGRWNFESMTKNEVLKIWTKIWRRWNLESITKNVKSEQTSLSRCRTDGVFVWKPLSPKLNKNYRGQRFLPYFVIFWSKNWDFCSEMILFEWNSNFAVRNTEAYVPRSRNFGLKKRKKYLKISNFRRKRGSTYMQCEQKPFSIFLRRCPGFELYRRTSNPPDQSTAQHAFSPPSELILSLWKKVLKF